MEAMLFIVVTYAAIQILSAASVPYLCVRGEFYNRDLMDCVKCSDCPANQVPLRACWNFQDTVCGTLGKFQFRQPSSQQQPVISSDDLQSETDVTHQLPVPHQTTVEVAEDVSGDEWLTITMVLVGMLVFMCILGVILLFITCYVCKKTKREIVCDPGKFNNFVGFVFFINFEPGLVARSDARLSGIQEVTGLIFRSGNILSCELVIKTFLRPFSPTTDSSRTVVSY